MQEVEKKEYFKKKLGETVRVIRMSKGHNSLSKFAAEYELDKGNLNRIERGVHSIELFTLWKLVESLGIDIAEFMTLFKQELGDDFTLIDE